MQTETLAVKDNSSVKIISLTEAGLRLAERLQVQLKNSEVWYKPKPFAEKVQNAFQAGEPLIMICATGIVVRTLAPVLASKLQDPPVLVLDELGQFVIPLVSGHEGGANEWGRQIAELLNSQLVMTTANPYLKPKYAVGMGCERHCPKEELERLLMDCLAQANLTLDQIGSINSIDIKADEVGLIELAECLDKPFNTFDAAELSTMEHLLSTKSDYVFKTVGVYGVAESAALVGASQLTNADSELILNKHKTAKATCAIARAYPSDARR
ncbi:cobalt-precorrin 5A hydrolase [Litoribrevibacter euphylliae]|uniref:Cobalt-precorrin 5A hydrolase n=1 Tax=Litoribrevibacter euphylliae TaxID=1834034 RepID=A0ABV7HE60_9GAMM